MKFKRGRYDFYAGSLKIELGRVTRIAGVLNITPDSFSDGGRYFKPDEALRRALELEREGADIIDVGAESSRPGAYPVTAKEEIARLKNVFKRIARSVRIPLSVDTYKYETAAAALDLGAVIINDINGLRRNRRLAKLIARYNAGVILMHKKGSPMTMQKGPRYKDLVEDLKDFLTTSVGLALECGISENRIMIDPGFGFGKSFEHNMTILRSLEALTKIKKPLFVGLSRKSFIGKIIGADPDERLNGSLGAAAVALLNGAHFLRVHDVRAHRHLVQVVDEVFF